MAARRLLLQLRPVVAAAAAGRPPPPLAPPLARLRRALSTEVGEMAALYDDAAAPPQRTARERRVPTAQRISCSVVVDMAVERLLALRGDLGALDGRWFFDVLHALKEGAYHSPASRSAGLRKLLAALTASLVRHPDMWETHHLSASAAALAGFATRGLLPNQQRQLFVPDGAAAKAMHALGATFGARLAQAGHVQVANMLWALVRAGLPTHALLGRAAAWLAAAEARDDCYAALCASAPGCDPPERALLEARLTAACAACDAERAPRPAPLFAEQLDRAPRRRAAWAPAGGDGGGARQLAPGGYVSVLRADDVEVRHLVVVLWALSRAVAASSSGSADGGAALAHAPAREATGRVLHAACIATLRRLLLVADGTSLFSASYVAAVSDALRALGGPPLLGPSMSTVLSPPAAEGEAMGSEAGVTGGHAPARLSAHSRRAIWTAVARGTGADLELDRQLATVGAAAAGHADPSAAAAPWGGGAALANASAASSDELGLFDEDIDLVGLWSSASGDAASGDAARGDAAGGRGRVRLGQQPGRAPPPVLSAQSLALQPLQHVLGVAWASVASWSIVLLPLLRPRQLATILDSLSRAAVAAPPPVLLGAHGDGGAATPPPAALSTDEWPCAFPRKAVLHTLLRRVNLLLKERGNNSGGPDGEQFASVFRPSEVGAVASALLQFQRLLATGASADAPGSLHSGVALFSPWKLEDWVPLSFLAHQRLFLAAAPPASDAGAAALAHNVAGCDRDWGALQERPLASSSRDLDAAIAVECRTLLTLAGDVALANLHSSYRLQLSTANRLIAASVGIAGTVDAGAQAGHVDALRVGGMARGQLSALAVHVAQHLNGGQATTTGRDDEPTLPSATLDEQLDSLWALAAAVVAQAPLATSARAVLFALCEKSAPDDMTLRQLASLSAAAALSAVPLPPAAAVALLSAASAHLSARANADALVDAGAVMTLAWAVPFVLAGSGGLRRESPLSLDATMLLLQSLCRALASMAAAAPAAAGVERPPASADELRPLWDILTATSTVVAALQGTAHGASPPATTLVTTVVPPSTRLRTVQVAFARWGDAVRLVLGDRHFAIGTEAAATPSQMPRVVVPAAAPAPPARKEQREAADLCVLQVLTTAHAAAKAVAGAATIVHSGKRLWGACLSCDLQLSEHSVALELVLAGLVVAEASGVRALAVHVNHDDVVRWLQGEATHDSRHNRLLDKIAEVKLQAVFKTTCESAAPLPGPRDLGFNFNPTLARVLGLDVASGSAANRRIPFRQSSLASVKKKNSNKGQL
jgi:hypothetical protein